MLLGLPDRKLLTKFQLPSALSNILLLMPEECKGGNGEKCNGEMCLSFRS